MLSFDPYVKQSYPDSCAIKCQQIILWNYGIDISENELCKIATEKGWYHEHNGVYMHDNGKLLLYFGIKYHHSQHNAVEKIDNELQMQHCVMININKNKLIDNNFHDISEASHAMLVTNIDLMSPTKKIYLIDTANGNANFSCCIETFNHAWDDSSYYMLATESPMLYKYDHQERIMKKLI